MWKVSLPILQWKQCETAHTELMSGAHKCQLQEKSTVSTGAAASCVCDSEEFQEFEPKWCFFSIPSPLLFFLSGRVSLPRIFGLPPWIMRRTCEWPPKSLSLSARPCCSCSAPPTSEWRFQSLWHLHLSFDGGQSNTDCGPHDVSCWSLNLCMNGSDSPVLRNVVSLHVKVWMFAWMVLIHLFSENIVFTKIGSLFVGLWYVDVNQLGAS